MRSMPPSFRLPFERPIYELEDKLTALETQPNPTASSKDEIRNMRQEIARMTRDIFDNLDAWEIVKVARHPERPQMLDYIELVFEDFLELHGDKSYGDDRAIVTGFARIDGRKVLVVGQHKGRNLKERNE